MDIITDFVVLLSKWCRTHLSDIALALMAAFLVLVGPMINRWLKRSIGHLNFVFRTLLFILVCAFGYGLAIIFLTPWLASGLAQFNNYTLAPVLLLIFILVGVFADRN